MTINKIYIKNKDPRHLIVQMLNNPYLYQSAIFSPSRLLFVENKFLSLVDCESATNDDKSDVDCNREAALADMIGHARQIRINALLHKCRRGSFLPVDRKRLKIHNI